MEKNVQYHAWEILRGIFSDLYATELSWDDIEKISLAYPHPHDRALFWMRPLRHLLASQLLNPDLKTHCYKTFIAKLSHYAQAETVANAEYFNMWMSNQAYFESPYNARNAKSMESYWNHTGYKYYAEYLKEYAYSPWSTQEIAELCSFLGLQLAVYDPSLTKIGYAQEDGLGCISVTYDNGEWLFYDNIPNHFTYLDYFGKSQLTIDMKPHTLSERIQAVLTVSAIPDSHANLLEEAIIQGNIPKLIDILIKDKCDFIDEATSTILLYAAQQQQIAVLATCYQFNPVYRNFLLYNDIPQLRPYYNLMKATAADALTWEETLHTQFAPHVSLQGDTPLHKAMRANQIQKVRELLQGGANLYAPNAHKVTPLHLACALNKVEHLNEIVQHHHVQCARFFNRFISHPKLNLNCTDSEGSTPLHYAAGLGYLSVVKALCAISKTTSVFDILAQNYFGNSAYALAKINEQEAVVAYLTQQGGQDFFYEAKEALRTENLDVFNALLTENKNLITAQDIQGYTLLHLAVIQALLPHIKALLALEANVNATTKQGETPLHISVAKDNLEIFTMLVEAKADLHYKTYPSYATKFKQPPSSAYILSPLDFALASGKSDIIRAAVDNSACRSALREARTPQGESVLHFFAHAKDNDYFVKALECIFAIPENTPEELKESLDAETIMLLRGESILSWLVDNQGITPLHIAAQNNDIAIIKSLIKANKLQCILHKKTPDYKNAYKIALHQDSFKITRLLRKQGAVLPSIYVSLARKATALFQGGYDTYQAQAKEREVWTNNPYYQYPNLVRAAIPTIASLASPFNFVGYYGGQILMYVWPAVRASANNKYYEYKYHMHNHRADKEWALDTIGSIGSAGNGLSQGYSWLNYFSNIVMYGVGSVGSYTAAKIAVNKGYNQNVQALAYFAGEMLGMGVVSIYQQYPHQAQNTLVLTANVEKGLTIWSSLVGKRIVEPVLYGAHRTAQVYQAFAQNIGAIEHGITYYTPSIITWAADATLWRLLGGIQQTQRAVTYYTDYTAALMEEGLLCLVPESDYKTHSFKYLYETHKQQLVQQLFELQSNKEVAQDAVTQAQEQVTQLETQDAPLCEEARQVWESQKADAAQTLFEAKDVLHKHEIKYQAHVADIEKVQAYTQSLWDKTSKGIQEKALLAAQEDVHQAATAHEEAKFTVKLIERLEIENEDLQAAREKVASTSAAYERCKENATQAENAYITELNYVEQERFLKNKIELESAQAVAQKEWDTAQENYFQKIVAFKDAQNEEYRTYADLMEIEHTYNLTQEQYDAVQQQIYAIEHPGGIDLSALVEKAFNDITSKRYGDSVNKTKITNTVIDAIVATGIISKKDANDRMHDSFINALDSSSNKIRHLKAAVKLHWDSLFVDFKSSLVHQIQFFSEHINSLKEKYQILLQKHQDKLLKVAEAKEAYIHLLPENMQNEVAQQESNHLNQMQQARHSAEFTGTILSLVGQSNYAMDAALYKNKDWHAQQHNHVNSNIAALWLAHYKYFFIKEYNVSQLLNEKQNIAQQLQNKGFNIENFADEKIRIDEEIAQIILQQAITAIQEKDHPEYAMMVANNVVSTLVKGLTTDLSKLTDIQFEGKPLNEMLSQMISENKIAEGIIAIQQSLQHYSESASIQAVGKWEHYSKPVPIESVTKGYSKPEKKHGWRKFFNIILTGAAQNGASLIMHRNGIDAGLTNQNMFSIYHFQSTPKMTFTFEPPKYASPLNAASQGVSTGAQSKPMPSVIPIASFKPNTPLPALVQKENSSIVSALPASVQPAALTYPGTPIYSLTPPDPTPSLKGPVSPPPILFSGMRTGPLQITDKAQPTQSASSKHKEDKNKDFNNSNRVEDVTHLYNNTSEENNNTDLHLPSLKRDTKVTLPDARQILKQYEDNLENNKAEKNITIPKLGATSKATSPLSSEHQHNNEKIQSKNAPSFYSLIPNSEQEDIPFPARINNTYSNVTSENTEDTYKKKSGLKTLLKMIDPFGPAEAHPVAIVVGSHVARTAAPLTPQMLSSALTYLGVGVGNTLIAKELADNPLLAFLYLNFLPYHADSVTERIQNLNIQQFNHQKYTNEFSFLSEQPLPLVLPMLTYKLMHDAKYVLTPKEDNDRLTFPIHTLESSFYPGGNREDHNNGLDILSFPIHLEDFSKLVNPVKQPGSELPNHTKYPAFENFKEFNKPYLKNNDNEISPNNINNGKKLQVYLALQNGNILDKNGKLTEYAIEKSKIAIGKNNPTLGNPAVVQELTKDGSNIERWTKYKTPNVTLSTGQKIEIHYYKNKDSGEVNYNIDYKVKEQIVDYKNRYRPEHDKDIWNKIK